MRPPEAQRYEPLGALKEQTLVAGLSQLVAVGNESCGALKQEEPVLGGSLGESQ